MITACIVLLYLSYSIPVICLLVRGRSNIKPGPFWLGPMGLFSNIVLLLWTLFTLVMYSFPYAKPVAASNMNCKPFAIFPVSGLDHLANLE
jgi:choline transport protein